MSKLTVVFEVVSEDSFADVKKILMDNFHGSPTNSWAIRAASIEHEIRRLSHIEEIIDNLDAYAAIDEIREILSTDPEEYDVEAAIEEYKN